MDSIEQMHISSSNCRICLGEYDESAMQDIFTDNEKDLTDADTDEAEESADEKQTLNSQIESCCGVKIRHATHLPSKACERCCDFVRMWLSFRQMCLNSQVYLESMYIQEGFPNELIDAGDSENMENLYEALQVQAPTRYSKVEELEFADSPQIESDYIVDYDEESFVADAIPVEQERECSKNNLQEILSELETYDADEDEQIEVEPTVLYPDNSHSAEIALQPKVEDCEFEYDDDNEEFLSTTPSPDPIANTITKRRPGRPRKSDSELKVKRKPKSSSHPRNDSETNDAQMKYICNFCGNVYRKKSAFTAHMMVHTNYKPHQCEICSKSFRQMGELRAHIRRHTGERPYKCLFCERHFYDRSEKVRHERVHTNTRPYECKECGKTFTHTAILKNHSLIHSGEKKFNCNICSKSFALLHQLKAHLQTLTHKSKEELSFARSTLHQENIE